MVRCSTTATMTAWRWTPIVQLRDGRWGAIEIQLGPGQQDRKVLRELRDHQTAHAQSCYTVPGGYTFSVVKCLLIEPLFARRRKSPLRGLVSTPSLPP
jgi:hypothetical protein